jgi:hypothetical protein
MDQEALFKSGLDKAAKGAEDFAQVIPLLNLLK